MCVLELNWDYRFVIGADAISSILLTVILDISCVAIKALLGAFSGTWEWFIFVSFTIRQFHNLFHWSGKRKSWHGNDVHTCRISERMVNWEILQRCCGGARRNWETRRWGMYFFPFILICFCLYVWVLLANWPSMPSVLNNSDIIQVIVPHGEAVTVESFLAWRERFEAELALERAKYIIINNDLILFLLSGIKLYSSAYQWSNLLLICKYGTGWCLSPLWQLQRRKGWQEGNILKVEDIPR